MLWVTMTMVYVLFELGDEVLDLGGGDGVERRRRLVHQEHLGLDGQGPGDAEALLLPAGEAQGGVIQAVFHLVPEGRLLEALLGDLHELRLFLMP